MPAHSQYIENRTHTTGMETLATGSKNPSQLEPIVDRRRGADRRKEIRMASKSASASLSVAARPPLEVEIRDVSRGGLGIAIPTPILVGSSVIVVCGGLTISGTVRHCRERLAGEYTAGISIDRILNTSAGKEI